MAMINLRPWREELRAEKQKQFITMLVATVIIAGGLGFLWLNYVESEITYQNSRNAYIEAATRQLDKKIVEISDLRKKKSRLIARMKVIQDLQGKRPVIVRVFDEMVRTLPDGLYYTSLSARNGNLSISGIAESNNRISGLMRTFEASDWFGEPNLSSVAAASSDSPEMNAFSLTVPQTTPADKNVKSK
ncbi:MAG: pilus assembly protein PilN [Gammaproteobacteria bacterium]|nr:MAG: pilus assembly protein PilN [Pseudomonadota bacterium]PIE38715.1 MAG: pilus assembly protein PilN [Gammaproteobacteria bacterium]